MKLFSSQTVPAALMPKRFFAGICILSFAFAANIASADVLGFWNFDEQPAGNSADAGAGAILDSSGNNHHLNAMGDPLPVYVDGPALYGGTRALHFSSTDDRVFLNDTNMGPFDFGSADSFTLEAVVRTAPGASFTGAIVAKDWDSNLPSWWMRIANGNLVFLVSQNGGPQPSVTGNIPINDGEWHHVAAVRDGGAKTLRVYVDGLLAGQATDTTTDTLANNQTVTIGGFNSGSRQFEGDIDFVRISSGALVPSEFVQGVTTLTDVSPEDGSSYLPSTTEISFAIDSPTIGVQQSDVHLLLNDVDVSGQLDFSGDIHHQSGTFSPLIANRLYTAVITVVDQQSNSVSRTIHFDTFSQNLLAIEAEDYNFESGQFIDNPALSSIPASDNYLDRIATEGIDHHEINTAPATQYRIGDTTGTVVTKDVLRQNFLDAQENDPGVADYDANSFVTGEWLNYTRTIPAGACQIFMRVAKSGVGSFVVKLDEVVSGSATDQQTLSAIGEFHGDSTASASTYEFVPLTDVFGRNVVVAFDGTTTLRATMQSGVSDISANYFLLAPALTGTNPPYISETRPIPNAGNELASPEIFAAIRNSDTSVNVASIRLQLDGADVTASASINATDSGANVSYTPAPLAIGLHNIVLIFEDSAAASITNQWQFRVANQAVRGYWKFNESPAGTLVSTNPGAILDFSGNERNGTANDAAMAYVVGSLNYGNTPALHFTTNSDRVVISDPVGNFNYQTSFTFEAVVRATGTGTSPALLAKNGTTGGEGEYWWRVPGAAGGVQRIGINDGSGGKFLAGTTPLNDGNWHHVAAVYDQAASEIRLYADYNPDGSLSGVNFTGTIGRTADLHIGSFVNGGSEFSGDIDFIRISTGALTPDQFIQTSVALAPIVNRVSPADGAIFVAPQPVIRAEIQNRDTQVALETLQISIDGSDVTAQATVTADTDGAVVEYQPASLLASGLHTAAIVFSDNGSPSRATTNQWQFSVAASLPVVALYRFDEKAPGNTADLSVGAILDSSGNNHLGTTSNEMFYVGGSPDFGNSSALEFTTGPDNIFVPDPNGEFNFTPAQSVTMEVVMRTVNIGQSGVGSLLAKQGAAPGEWWWRINANGKQQFFVNDSSGGKSVSGVAVLNDGNWHHLAAIYDGVSKELRIFVDGQIDGAPFQTGYTSTENIIGNAKDLWIGAFQAGNRQFDGDIDLVRITAAPLDPSSFVPPGGISSELKLTGAVIDGGNLSFSFATESGHSYSVQSTGTLGSGWTEVENISGDGTVKTVAYPLDAERKFFRVQMQ